MQWIVLQEQSSSAQNLWVEFNFDELTSDLCHWILHTVLLLLTFEGTGESKTTETNCWLAR